MSRGRLILPVLAAGCALALGADPSAAGRRPEHDLNFRSRSWRISGATRIAPKQGELAIKVALPRDAVLTSDFSIDCAEDSAVTYEVFLPAQAHGVKHQLFFQDKDGVWFGARVERPLKPGGWNKVQVDISHDTGDLVPSGHRGGWDSYVASQVNGIGIKFLSNVPYTGPIELSRFRVERSSVPPGRLKLFDFAENRRRVPLYGKYEVSFRLSLPFENPFDPSEVSVDAIFDTPSQKGVKHAGFYYQEYTRELKNDREILAPFGHPCWKIRFTPTEVGNYSYRIAAQCRGNTITTSPRTFRCVPISSDSSANPQSGIGNLKSESRNPQSVVRNLKSAISNHQSSIINHQSRGFVRVSKKDPRYFEFTNGDFFYPIGQNIHAPFDTRSAEFLKIPLRKSHGTFTYDYFFKKMSEHGENMVVMWMCSWWLALEWFDQWPGYVGLGRYNLQNAWRLDYLLEQCRKYGIYVHLVVDNHGKLSLRVDSEWDLNPYNADLGGPLTHPDQFFTDPGSREYYKRKMRYFIARWGYSPNLFGFELWGELNLTGSESAGLQVAQREWHQEMGRYIKQIDPWDHLLTTHFSNDFRRVDSAIAALPEMDYVVCDAYKGAGSVAPLMLLTYEANGRYGKPCFVTEFGGNWNAGTPEKLRADLHDGLWANWFTHSAATPLIWWFDFVDKHDLYSEYASLSRFAGDIDRRAAGLVHGRPRVTPDGLTSSRRLEPFSLQNDRIAYVWVSSQADHELSELLDLKREIKGAAVSVPGLTPGAYHVEIWNTQSGKAVSARAVEHVGEHLEVPLPDFTHDIALKLKIVEGKSE